MEDNGIKLLQSDRKWVCPECEYRNSPKVHGGNPRKCGRCRFEVDIIMRHKQMTYNMPEIVRIKPHKI